MRSRAAARLSAEISLHIDLVSYNVHGCVGWDGAKDPERVAAVLSETGGDIVALQEVPALDKGGHAFLQRVSALTGLTAIAGSELLSHCTHYGNALLTRFSSQRMSTLYLGVRNREPRGAINVELDCGPVRLTVIATHLGLSPAERRDQIQRILPVVTNQTSPVVLLGDINEWFTWGRPLRWLHAAFGRPPAPRSFPSVLPAFRLDRVWVSRPSVVTSVRAHSSPLARKASDHLPVKACAELRWADYEMARASPARAGAEARRSSRASS
ncbi:MAG: endonuclease/exonuclease/phosphatase family protein [Burkholderiales bacterium]|nr:endonuclease/exonuclease/phosphatase family protein [Burkholderiales bacterium]